MPAEDDDEESLRKQFLKLLQKHFIEPVAAGLLEKFIGKYGGKAVEKFLRKASGGKFGRKLMEKVQRDRSAIYEHGMKGVRRVQNWAVKNIPEFTGIVIEMIDEKSANFTNVMREYRSRAREALREFKRNRGRSSDVVSGSIDKKIRMKQSRSENDYAKVQGFKFVDPEYMIVQAKVKAPHVDDDGDIFYDAVEDEESIQNIISGIVWKDLYAEEEEEYLEEYLEENVESAVEDDEDDGMFANVGRWANEKYDEYREKWNQLSGDDKNHNSKTKNKYDIDRIHDFDDFDMTMLDEALETLGDGVHSFRWGGRTYMTGTATAF